MKEQFVTYEIALKLKELGFDEPCFSRWTHGDSQTFPNIHFRQDYKNRVISDNHQSDYWILAPLWQQAIDWLRKVHEIHINVDCFSEKGGTKWDYQIVKCDYDSVGLPGYILTEFADGRNYLAYENALESGLVEALKWVKFRKEQL